MDGRSIFAGKTGDTKNVGGRATRKYRRPFIRGGCSILLIVVSSWRSSPLYSGLERTACCQRDILISGANYFVLPLMK